MKFSLVIYSAPYSSEASHSALHFARAVLRDGHDIYRLFFFGDGVHNANRLAVTAQDEENLQLAWDRLIRDNALDSVVCVTSSLKRGIINAAEAQRHELDGDSLLQSSEIAGLGQLVDATLQSDRVVNFG